MQNRNPKFTGVEDDSLVLLAQSGDGEAFSELISRHQNSCTKLAMSALRDRAEAEDQVQNASIKAFEHLRQFQRDAKFSTWLTRIVLNQCLMRLRQLRRAKYMSLDSVEMGDEVMSIEPKETRANAEQTLGGRQISEVVRREIKRIPPLLHKPLMLRDIENLPMSEVAAQLGISVAAAKSRLLRARQELRVRLEKYCGKMGPASLTTA